MDAVNDERRPTVLAQIANELEVWDGTGVDESGKTRANVEIALEFLNRQPRLSYLARCPAGFPEGFHASDRHLQTIEGGWYDPIPIPASDGAFLASGFNWAFNCNGKSFVLSRPQTRAIPLVAQETASALISNNCRSSGSKCAVICVDDQAASTAQYLSDVCGYVLFSHKASPRVGRYLLASMFLGVTSSLQVGWEESAADFGIQILYVGGLRVGNAYLKHATPRILGHRSSRT